MTAEKRLIVQRDRYVTGVRESWRGYEREMLISLVRALDIAAYIHHFAGSPIDGEPGIRLRGAATALRPLLEAVRNLPGPIPWFRSNPQLAPAFDKHLLDCGRFSIAIRLAAMERYGMATARIVSEDRILIEVISDTEECAELEAQHAAVGRASAAMRTQWPTLAAELPEVRRKLTRYGRTHMGWFIAYDNDQFLVDHYRAQARIQAAGVVEAEALPASGMIGGRAFSDWSEASTAAYGTVLHHIDAAGRLRQRKPNLNMRDLLTIYARRDDIVEVLVERGNDHLRAQQLMAGLTLDAEGAASSEERHEIPLPYYIDAGEHFVLLPMFGGLMNPHAGLLDFLRRTYRGDWDRIVDGRENVFREDLRRLLPEPRYKVLEKGLKLRRKDKSTLTDADAVVLDRQTGVVVFVQMKWYDVYGFNLAERDSRRENLLTKGNEWVDKVHNWIDGRTCAEISRTYGWGEAADSAPQLLVMARHSSQFAGETRYDTRASWTSWHALTEEMNDPACDGFVAAIAPGRGRKLSRDNPDDTSIIEIPGMTVEVRTARQR
ncbi:hypothetical protein [Sphingobium chlorophenolicum]|uniref:Uncharacterized protein n=1 Tax=Sphingobium chlorophenolicum TaxID=46429 RepID=A0A081RDJ4_SPHCR|nr:hypothetical protein [Sphingobium chlorophenolicum]KEQ53267.1 hypothetical protein BV95_02419 [Sphingobium chlorophenolicum]